MMGINAGDIYKMLQLNLIVVLQTSGSGCQRMSTSASEYQRTPIVMYANRLYIGVNK